MRIERERIGFATTFFEKRDDTLIFRTNVHLKIIKNNRTNNNLHSSARDQHREGGLNRLKNLNQIEIYI